MKVKLSFDQMKASTAAVKETRDTEKSGAEVRAITFAENRPVSGHVDSRRLFTPRNKINGISGKLRPRAILRMVSASC